MAYARRDMRVPHLALGHAEGATHRSCELHAAPVRGQGMIAGIVLVIGLLFLGMQMTDPSSNATLASEMSIAPDQALTDWAIFNRLIHFILDDIPLAGLLLF